MGTRDSTVVLVVSVLMFLGGSAAGQARLEDGRRVYEEQLRVELDRQQAAAREFGLDAGGWVSFAFFHYDDAPARTDRTLRQYELRLWGNYTLAGVHTFFVRGLTGYDDWNHGDNPDDHGDEYREPTLERAWYRFDYNRLVRNQTGRDPETGGDVTVGRQWQEIGSGFVLALPLDSVSGNLNIGPWTLGGLIGRTVEDQPNLDPSLSVADDMDRCFYGVQFGRTVGRHRPYVYYLWQFDGTGEHPRDRFQEYDYDSRYLGAGSRGSFQALPNLRYLTEVVFEQGRSFAEGTTSDPEAIHAMALDLQLDYYFPLPRQPKVGIEYIFGSGDGDRRLLSNSTVGGNRAGTRDEAFNAFGFRDTGLALAPDYSNLHIYSVGGSLYPLEDWARFRKMEVGSKVFFFHKDTPRGAISDIQGTNDARWVGWEWDVFVNWRVASDVAWTVRYGVFQPGSAMTDGDWRHFLYTGVTYSF